MEHMNKGASTAPQAVPQLLSQLRFWDTIKQQQGLPANPMLEHSPTWKVFRAARVPSPKLHHRSSSSAVAAEQSGVFGWR